MNDYGFISWAVDEQALCAFVSLKLVDNPNDDIVRVNMVFDFTIY